MSDHPTGHGKLATYSHPSIVETWWRQLTFDRETGTRIRNIKYIKYSKLQPNLPRTLAPRLKDLQITIVK
jgi:hypothetical protein